VHVCLEQKDKVDIYNYDIFVLGVAPKARCPLLLEQTEQSVRSMCDRRIRLRKSRVLMSKVFFPARSSTFWRDIMIKEKQQRCVEIVSKHTIISKS
jgi:hypothetical protein